MNLANCLTTIKTTYKDHVLNIGILIKNFFVFIHGKASTAMVISLRQKFE